MTERKRKKQGVWKERLRWIGKQVFKGSRAVVRVAFKLLRRLAKYTWKAGRRWWKKRHRRRKQPEPLLAPMPLIFGLAVVVIVAGSVIGRDWDTSCVLRQRVDSARIQQRWSDVRQWCPLIMQSSAKHDLDPHLIAAVMWLESAGNPQAYSHSGAVGLMQVMPRDGLAAGFQCPRGPCFADRPAITELRDPAFNVDYGSRLLAANIARLGSWRAGLHAYGPKDVGYSYADSVLSVYDQIR